MDVKKMARSGLTGWRKTAADKVAGPIERHSRFSRDQILAVLGALSLAMFARRVVKTMRRTADAGRAA